jgi:hypothetical protein
MKRHDPKAWQFTMTLTIRKAINSNLRVRPSLTSSSLLHDHMPSTAEAHSKHGIPQGGMKVTRSSMSTDPHASLSLSIFITQLKICASQLHAHAQHSSSSTQQACNPNAP